MTNTVTISGLTVTNGDCGIYSDHATLTVSNCVVTANKGGTHSVASASIIRSGRQRQLNAGITAMPGKPTLITLLVFATLTIANCVISDNSGSGVDNLSADVTIIDSTISGNFVGNSGGQFGRAAVFTQAVASSPGTSP